jgi:hypothetical protein
LNGIGEGGETERYLEEMIRGRQGELVDMEGGYVEVGWGEQVGLGGRKDIVGWFGGDKRSE